MHSSRFIALSVLTFLLSLSIIAPLEAKTVLDTARGYFIVQKNVKNAPLWYVPPNGKKRYCVQSACDPKQGPNKAPCFFPFRYASREVLNKIPLEREKKRTVAQKYLGYIIPDVVNEVEAWYVDPRNQKRYPVGAPDANALKIMRARAKKLTKQELAKIPVGLTCKKPTPPPPPPPPPPGIPGLIRIESTTCETLDLTWEKVSDADAYQIFRDGQALSTVFYPTTTFRDTGITGRHTYQVRSLNKNGASSFSSEEGIVIAQCAPPPPPPMTPKIPDAPTGTSLYRGGACNEVVFRWTAVADADTYEIFRDNKFYARVSKGIVSYITRSIPRGAQYAYQVRAVNAVGPSVLTAAKNSPVIMCGATPPPPPPTQPTQRAPNAPGNVRATAIACTQVYTQWNDVVGEDAYELLRNGKVVQRASANATGITDAQAQENTTATYTVRAVNTIGTSPPSGGVAVTTPACPIAPLPPAQGQPPQTPKFSQVTQIDCRTFLIRWDDVAGEDGYSLLRDSTVLQQTGPNVTTFTDTSLTPAFQYRYSIRAFNKFGNSAQSQPLIFKTGTCANVQAPPPPPPPVVSGTTTNCAQIGGTTCAQGEICGSRWLDVQGDNRCCASACQKYQVAQRCNYNSICEPQELDACSDCQCRGGVVCGGLCYGGLANDAECVDETLVHTAAKRPTQGMAYCADATQCGVGATCLLPGPCVLSAIPIKVTVQLPTQLEVGVWTQGTMTFLNTWTSTLSNHVYFETSGMDIEISLQQNSAPVALPRDWDLIQFQPNTPVTYTIRARMNTVSDTITPTHQLKHGTLDLRFFPNATANVTKSFYGFTRATAQPCGQYLWNIAGKCLGSIWYAGVNCQSGTNCIGRINDWGAITKTYPAKGTYAVLVMTAGLTTSQQSTYSANTLIGFGQEIRAFYAREAERIVGRPMVDFTFTFDNHYAWTIPDPQLQFLQGKQTVREYLESKIGRALSQQQYPFIIIAVPHLPGPAGYGYSEVGGMYHVGQGVILVRAAPGILQPQVIAHEFSHAFGCQDWYNGGGRQNRFFLCNERRANNLLCAAETAVPELQWFTRITQGYMTLTNRTLDDCAAEIGWGDMDNDGKVDIDPSITL